MHKFDIALFRTPTHPIVAKVKTFCDDFIVHEIDLDGNLIHLADGSQAIDMAHMKMPLDSKGSLIPSTIRYHQGDDKSKDLQELEQELASSLTQDTECTSHISPTSSHPKNLGSDSSNLKVMGDQLSAISQTPEISHHRIQVGVSKKLKDQSVARPANDISNCCRTTSDSYQQNTNNNLEQIVDDECFSISESSSNYYAQDVRPNIMGSHPAILGIDHQNVNDNIEDMENQFKQIMTKQLLENLQKFARQVQHINSDDDDSLCHQFVIGSVQDKCQRKIIRQYISYLYPHLQTMLQCKDDKVIVAKLNPSYNQFRDLLPEHQVDELMRFIAKTYITKSGSYAIDVNDLNKDKRRQLHHLISHLFGKFIESKTVAKISNNKSKNYIFVRYKSRIKTGRDDNNPLYLKFILRKRHRETLDALHYIAKMLRCRLSDFSYAGIKDCRALTYQQITVKNIRPQQMIHALEKINCQEDIHCGHYQFCHNPIKLGELKGNRFHIILRDIRLLSSDLCTKENINVVNEIIQSMEKVQCNGFINYFGSQRFGKIICTVNTYDIGLAMLRNDEKMAVDLILSSSMEDDKDNVVAAALKYYRESGDLSGTLVKIPSYKSRQVLVLKALHRYGQNSTGYRKALLSIPHNMRKMYIHSYCSLLWNRLVNYRIQTYGYDVVEGDLILVDSGKDQIDTNVDTLKDDHRIKWITKEDLAQGHYSIHDIVLPLLGSKTVFPANTIGSIYQEMLNKDDITHQSFNNPQLDIKIKGAYRKILCTPKDIIYSLHDISCQRLHDNCHDCCSNILKDQTLKPCHNDHQWFHFKLHVTLNPGSYATILLREITNNNDIM